MPPRKPAKKRQGFQKPAAKRSSLPRGYEKQESHFGWWKPQAGEVIAGTVVRYIETEHGTTPAIDIGGGEVRGLPNHALLTDLLTDAEIGDDVYIICTKAGSTGKGNAFQYEVGLKKAPPE